MAAITDKKTIPIIDIRILKISQHWQVLVYKKVILHAVEKNYVKLVEFRHGELQKLNGLFFRYGILMRA